MAAVLGWLAWKNGKMSTHWAEQSTHWSKMAAELQDAALPVHFIARMQHTGDPPWFNAWLEIEVEGSTPVFIHKVETLKGAFFGSGQLDEPIDWDDLSTEQPIKPAFDDELPKRLLPGETRAFHNPWSSYSPVLTPKASARVRVSFSVTSESPRRGVEIDVDLGIAA